MKATIKASIGGSIEAVGRALGNAGSRVLFALPPETAHQLSIRALEKNWVPPVGSFDDPRLRVKIAGLEFPNPVGLAAGYDKNAQVIDPLLRMGFGFAEAGTVTPRPQTGNPRPRIFRLSAQRGVINRLGFNNKGHEAVAERLKAREPMGVVGVNIGANKDSDDFIADYEAGISAFSELASYFTANISSPNTPGLRDLQSEEALRALLTRVLARRDELAAKSGRRVPVFLKLAPDLDTVQMEGIATALGIHPPDAVIISNTTVARDGVGTGRKARQAGGLSGAPLFERSTIVLARMRKLLPAGLPIIGVGGIDSVETAIAKFEAGAKLVQLYTGMVYRGPSLPWEINRGLLAEIDRRGLDSVTRLTATAVETWAARKLPEER